MERLSALCFCLWIGTVSEAGWETFQSKRRLQEREDRIKNHLTLAASGPLRQTFAKNPLKDLPLEASKPPPKKRPWEDTLI